MKIYNFRLIPYILIIVAALFLFSYNNGSVHLFDWDEINFAESAREMIVSDNYLDVQINFKPFWEKPPLFIWMQAASMKIFGVNEYAARFPNVICGIFTLLLLFNIGEKLYDTQFGWFWVLAYAGSILPFLYFKSGIIDPWFNFFIFYGIHHFIIYTSGSEKTGSATNLILSAVSIGLAILTKGPVAGLIFILTFIVFIVFNKFKPGIKLTPFIVWGVLAVLVGSSWFIMQMADGNSTVIVDFIKYQIRLFKTQDAGHGGFFGYHFVVLLIGVFPASIYGLKGLFFKSPGNFLQEKYKKWMVVLFMVVLILFTIVKTKIVHYSSLAYFPLTYLATYAIYYIKNNRLKFSPWIAWLIVIIGVIISLLVIVIPWLDTEFKRKLLYSIEIKDAFALKNIMANVSWSGSEWLIGLILLAGIFIYLFIKKFNYQLAIVSLLYINIIFVFLTVVHYTGKIEGHSQNAAIEFYKRIKNEDCYVRTLGFKSYAHLFYAEVKPLKNKNAEKISWLLNDSIDKPVYFVTKIDKKRKVLHNKPQLEVLYEKNGFVFCKRKENSNIDD